MDLFKITTDMPSVKFGPFDAALIKTGDLVFYTGRDYLKGGFIECSTYYHFRTTKIVVFYEGAKGNYLTEI